MIRLRKKQKCWLTDVIQQEREETLKISFSWRQKLKSIWNELSYPKRTTVLRTALYAIIIYVAILDFLYYILKIPLVNLTAEHTLASLWQVCATLGGILLSILIFAIEFVRDEKTLARPKTEVLVRETKIVPIFFFYLITIGILGLTIKFNLSFIFNFILFFLVIVSIGYAYFRTFQLIFYEGALKEKSVSLLKEKVRLAMDYSIDTRIGQNIFLQKLKEIRIDYNPFRLGEEKNEYLSLNAPKTGYITNIDLCRLEGFIRVLPWKPTEESEKVSEGRDPTETSLEKEKFDKTKKNAIVISHLFRELITKENSTLLYLKKKLFEKLDKAKLEKEIETIFRFEEQNTEELKSKELERELLRVKEEAIRCIKREKPDSVLEESLNVFKEAIESFVERLKEFKVTYNRERALKEFGSFEEGWVEIKEISRDIVEIIDESFEKPRQKILSKVIYFPILIADIALKEKDYYIFHAFTYFYPYIYKKAINIKKIKDKELKTFVIDRIWRYWSEFAIYPIGPEFDKIYESRDIEKISQLKDFAVGVILIFNNLLKSAYDSKRMDDFSLFKEKFKELYRHNIEEFSEDIIENQEWLLERNDVSEEEKNKIRKEIKFAKMWREVQEIKNYALFGLASWITEDYAQGKLKPEKFKEWYKLFPAFENLEKLTSFYYDIQKDEIEELFGWDWWILNRQEEGKVAQINFDRYLTRFYCIKALEIIANLSEEKQKELMIPCNRKTFYVIETEESPVRVALKSLEKEKEKWSTILEDKIFNAIPTFIKILDKTVKKQKEIEKERIIKAPLDLERIERFKKDFIMGWKKKANLRRIIKNYGNFYWPSKKQAPKGFLGVNRLDRKDIYIKDSDISISGWGENYGEDLANVENRSIGSHIVATLPEFEKIKVKKPEEIVKSLNQCLKELESKNYNPAIIVSNAWFCLVAIENSSDDFVPVSSRKLSESMLMVGKYKGRPVFNLPYLDEPLVLVVDFKKLGSWNQFKPKKEFEEEENLEYFNFFIKAIDKPRAEELIKKDPCFLEDKTTGKGKTKEEAIEELRQRVHLRIVEQFRFDIADPNAGYKILVERDF